MNDITKQQQILDRVIVKPHKSQWIDNLGDLAFSDRFFILEAILTLWSKVLTKDQLQEAVIPYIEYYSITETLPFAMFFNQTSPRPDFMIASFGQYRAECRVDAMNIAYDAVQTHLERESYRLIPTLEGKIIPYIKSKPKSSYVFITYRTTASNNKITRHLHKVLVEQHKRLSSVLSDLQLVNPLKFCKPIHCTTRQPRLFAFDSDRVLSCQVEHYLPESPMDFDMSLNYVGDDRVATISVVCDTAMTNAYIKKFLCTIIDHQRIMPLAAPNPTSICLGDALEDYDDFLEILKRGLA